MTALRTAQEPLRHHPSSMDPRGGGGAIQNMLVDPLRHRVLVTRNVVVADPAGEYEDTAWDLYQGAYVGTCTLTRGGHGSQAAVAPDGHLVTWTNEDGGWVVKFPWRDGRLSIVDTQRLDWLGSLRVLPAISGPYLGLLRTNADASITVTIRRWAEASRGISAPLAQVRFPPAKHLTPFQGYTCWYDEDTGVGTAWVLTGPTLGRGDIVPGQGTEHIVVREADSTGALVERVWDRLGLTDDQRLTLNHEPEGMQVLVTQREDGTALLELLAMVKVGAAGDSRRLVNVVVGEAVAGTPQQPPEEPDEDDGEEPPMADSMTKPLWNLADQLAAEAAAAAARAKAEAEEQAERERIAALARRNLRPDGVTPISPVAGWPITTPYGRRKAGLWSGKGYHTGEDRHGGRGEADRGAAIVAVRGGIAHRHTDPSLGRVLLVYRDGGGTDWYCHTQAYKVADGARVKTGQVVATAGDSGSGAAGVHLHHEWHPGVHNANWRSQDADPTW